MNVTNVIEVYV